MTKTAKVLTVFLLSAVMMPSCRDATRDIQRAEVSVKWDRENVITWQGNYARVHRLNDSRLIAVYEYKGKAYCRYSEDNANTWSIPELAIDTELVIRDGDSTWTNNANAECLQLSDTNPYHPGRIIYAVNIRPSGSRSDIFPFSIAYAFSDDNGASWSARKLAYQSDRWPSAEFKGCWEPFVLELPDGTVQIYFANETPYHREGLPYQNISVVESGDGGDSWGEVRTVAYTEGCRDGMPVVMTCDGGLYMAVEHYLEGEMFHPQIVWNPINENWEQTVTGDCETYRFDPLMERLAYDTNYYGAPYLIATDNFFVLSYQSSEGSDQATDKHSVMEVVVCPKSEMEDGTFRTMRCPTRPVKVDQTNSCARWNSLCNLGGDCILAVSDVSGTIVLTKGKITSDI